MKGLEVLAADSKRDIRLQPISSQIGQLESLERCKMRITTLLSVSDECAFGNSPHRRELRRPVAIDVEPESVRLEDSYERPPARL